MKKISIVIPTFNEEANVIPLTEHLMGIFTNNLSAYDYEIILIDNDSSDNTRPLIEGLCQQNPKIKAIFNAKNFGQMRSPYYGLVQSSGDAVILMCADFQDPPELIIQLVGEWEKGFKIITAIKKKSQENWLLYVIRSLYYWMIKKSPIRIISSISQALASTMPVLSKSCVASATPTPICGA